MSGNGSQKSEFMMQELGLHAGQNLSEVERFQMKQNKDNVELIRLGKRPVLKRNFAFMSMFGFNCTVMETWEIMLW
ncbi:MAG: hypothetical protein Q9227_002511 [Pyrenula ochraceoflavens]